MPHLYAPIDPYAQGMLEVATGEHVYWETCGSPAGKPVLVVHGGPGSGCTPWHRRLFDPDRYRIVLFDQRNCGRSIPHASAPEANLGNNNTSTLIADIELLREHLAIERWLLWGGSWGSTLALAYAESHAQRVTGMILWGVTTGRRSEFDWLFRGGVAAFFPEQWERLRAAVPSTQQDADVVAAYRELLNDPDPAVHQPAAEAWCLWESATADWPPTYELGERYRDPAFALAFARIVTHYVSHNAWLDDEALLRGSNSLSTIPGVIVNGRFDSQAPLGNAWVLHRAWPRAELVIVPHAGHSPAEGPFVQQLLRASDRFAGSEV
jgi:proline iminopeptidase